MSKELTPLDALKEIKETEIFVDFELNTTGAKMFEKQLDIIEKSLKALEIIKKKTVNLEYIKCCDNYEQYKTICSCWNEITQEEYDLLKAVLKND